MVCCQKNAIATCDLIPRRVADVPTETFEFRASSGSRVVGDFQYCLDASMHGGKAYEYIERVEVLDAGGRTVESYDGHALRMLDLMDNVRRRDAPRAASAAERRLVVCPLRVTPANNQEGTHVRVTLDADFARENLFGHWMKVVTTQVDRHPALLFPHKPTNRKFSYAVGVSSSSSPPSAESFRSRDQKAHGCVPPVVVDVPLDHFVSHNDLILRDIVITVSRKKSGAEVPALLSMRLHGGGGPSCTTKGVRTDGVFASRIAPPELYNIPPSVEGEEEAGGGILYFYPSAFIPSSTTLCKPFLRVKLAPFVHEGDHEVTVHVLAVAKSDMSQERRTIEESTSAVAAVTNHFEHEHALRRRRLEEEQQQQQLQLMSVGRGEEDVDDFVNDALRALFVFACIVVGTWVLPALFEQAGKHMERQFTALIMSV